jgi:hypothetical protein
VSRAVMPVTQHWRVDIIYAADDISRVWRSGSIEAGRGAMLRMAELPLMATSRHARCCASHRRARQFCAASGYGRHALATPHGRCRLDAMRAR